jgi:hypothetical protein
MEQFILFGGGNAGVGGETVEVVEAGAGGPGREGGFAELGEALLEAFEDFAGLGIAGRDGATCAGIAALEICFTDFEADYAAFVFTEELVFPERGDAVDFEGGAETFARFVEGDAGKSFGSCGKPLGNGLQGCCGNDGRAACDSVIRETAFGVTNDDLLLEEHAEPFSGVLVSIRKGKRARGNFTAIARDGESDFAKIGGVCSADNMDGRSALAIDPLPINGVKGPGAIKRQAAGRADASFRNRDGVERFDGVEADVDQLRRDLRKRHDKSLAEGGRDDGIGKGYRRDAEALSSEEKRNPRTRPLRPR